MPTWSKLDNYKSMKKKISLLLESQFLKKRKLQNKISTQKWTIGATNTYDDEKFNNSYVLCSIN